MVADFRDGYAASLSVGPGTLFAFLVRSYVDLGTSLWTEWRSSDSVIVFARSVSAALLLWVGAIAMAALEWPDGPATMWFFAQLGVALTSCAVVTIGIAQRSGPQPPKLIGRRTSG
jgi:hypothetical protein